ncbi:MAG: flagellar M-ring protein FliF C-terminal domain-containing protein [bacterium]|nr:flagellar M-ring protein FliF C-terminal domain-containing protein [bacterium]
MDFKQLLENKVLMASIIGGVVLLLIIFIICGSIAASNNNKGEVDVSNEPLKVDVDLLTTDNLGKALEIQALLARNNIVAARAVDGTKSVLRLKKGDCTPGMKKCTTEQRDRAIMVIVESGLYDQNVGLEIFDKGDFTSTKEDKRIRLVRAMNGELARLIRRIDGIENASVFISIPEQTMFSSMQKPVTATVQLTVAVGQTLNMGTIKAVTNLLLGSVSGLTAQNISITDTNGHVYNSMVDAQSEMLERLQANDKYMQEKVSAQLNRLIGSGKYVATVSTFLKQAPVEKFTIAYDPNEKTAVNEQVFSEGLGDQTTDVNKNTNAVSVYLPNGLPAGSSDSSQNRSYSRTAKETQYGVTKVQTNEYISPGVLEEISIAVTLEKDALPVELTLEELKELVAHAASPKASPDNVTIAFADSLDPFMAGDKNVKAPIAPNHGNPWWLAIALLAFGLFFGHKALSQKINAAKAAQEEELIRLREQNAEQEKQLKNLSVNAADMLTKQSQLQQGLLEQQNRPSVHASGADIREALKELKREFDGVDDSEAGEKIRSWIEQG